jgi:hypothetical protein
MVLHVTVQACSDCHSEKHQAQEAKGLAVTSPTRSLRVVASLESTGAVLRTPLRLVKQTGWAKGDRAQCRTRKFTTLAGPGRVAAMSGDALLTGEWESCDVQGPGSTPTLLKVRRQDGTDDEVDVTHMRTAPAGEILTPKSQQWQDAQRPGNDPLIALEMATSSGAGGVSRDGLYNNMLAQVTGSTAAPRSLGNARRGL